MADNPTIDNGGLTDYVVATDDDGTAHHQYVKLEWGADNTQTKVASGASALPIQDGGNSITVDGTVAVTGVSTAANQTTIIGHVDGIEALLTTIDSDTSTLATTGGGTETGALRVTIANNSTGVLSVDDNGSSLTVDNAALSVTGGGVEASALRVTIASDSTGVVSVDDNGGSLTVDGTVAVSGTVAVTDNSGSLTVDNGGTFAVQVTSLPASTNTIEVVGDAAEDAALAGNPVRVGGRASQARPTAMSADGDVVSPWYDRAGALHTVPGAATTATLSNVSSSASSTSVLASSTSRKGVVIHNDSTQILYIKYGTTASTSSYTYKIPSDATWEMPTPIYTGAIDGIWASANGNARVTELT